MANAQTAAAASAGASPLPSLPPSALLSASSAGLSTLCDSVSQLVRQSASRQLASQPGKQVCLAAAHSNALRLWQGPSQPHLPILASAQAACARSLADASPALPICEGAKHIVCGVPVRIPILACHLLPQPKLGDSIAVSTSNGGCNLGRMHFAQTGF